MRRTIYWLAFNLIFDLLATILSLDLLYLFVKHGWYDPNPFYQWSEVVVLLFIAGGGPVMFILEIKEFVRQFRSS